MLWRKKVKKKNKEEKNEEKKLRSHFQHNVFVKFATWMNGERKIVPDILNIDNLMYNRQKNPIHDNRDNRHWYLIAPHQLYLDTTKSNFSWKCR